MKDQPERSAGPPADRWQRDLFAWALLAALLLLAALAGPFFAGKVYLRDDLGAFHLPTRAFYAQRLARGEPFDWMPQLYSGFYLTGEGQAGTYHPLHLLLYRCLSLRAAVCLEWLAAYPLMLAGTWLLLRRRLRRSDAAMVGSLLFTFSGFNLLHFLHPNAVAIVAHIPWLLWLLDVVLLDSRRSRTSTAWAGIVLLTGSQLLLGYPQYVWFSMLTEAAYAVFLLAGRKRTAGDAPGRRWASLAVAKGCGLLCGGIQLLPTADALARSARHSADAAFAQSGSLHPLNLVQLVAPYMFADRVVGRNTHELGLYAGAVPLMLVVWMLLRRRRLGALKPLAGACGGFAVGALVLALGKYGPLYRLQRYLPLVGHLRFPCRYIVLFHLAMAVLAAVGFVLLTRDCRRSRRRQGEAHPVGRPWQKTTIFRRRFTPLWVVVGVSVSAALVGLILQGRSWMAPVPAVLAGPLLLGTAAVLVAAAAKGTRAALVGLILLAAADLGVYGLSYSVYPYTMSPGQLVASLPTPPSPDGRVLASAMRFDRQRLQTGNQMTLAGCRRADGYAGLEPRRRLDYGRLAALRVAGVRWVRRTEATAHIEGLVPYDDRWWRVPSPLPRVRLVAGARQSHDPARDLGLIDVESTALTEVPLVLPEATSGAAAPSGAATVVSQRPGRLHIRCNCASPQLLVVSESYHDGWRAIVDGRPRQVFRTNGDFMGLPVGPGRQEVVLQFHPRSLDWGRMVSCLGMGLAVACLVGYQVRPSRLPIES